jgi:hypothetical protein
MADNSEYKTAVNKPDIKQSPRQGTEGTFTPDPNPPSKTKEEARQYGETAPPPEDRSPPEIDPVGGSKKSSSSGGVKVEILRSYWPKEQPHTPDDAMTANETVLRAGEVHSVSASEALDLIEIGAARRYKGE